MTQAVFKRSAILLSVSWATMPVFRKVFGKEKKIKIEGRCVCARVRVLLRLR